MRIKENRLERFLKNNDDIVKGCKILVVDDSLDILLLLESILIAESFIPVTEKNPLRALEIIDSTFDAIILDLMMPEMDGTEFLKIVRNNKKLHIIPIIILTAKSGLEGGIADLYGLGANDYITKPFLKSELIAKLKVHIRLKKLSKVLIALIKKLHRQNKRLQISIKKEELLNEKILERTLEIKKAKEEIEELNLALKHTSTHDELTTIFNRAAILNFLENDINRTKRINQNLSILMFDIDFFKNVNDTYGHTVGDQILRELSILVKNNIREIDLVGRYGGEEFIIILPDTALEEAKILAERILKKIEVKEFNTNQGVLNITISIGIAEYQNGQTIDKFIDEADKKLYEAKNSGRNCIKS